MPTKKEELTEADTLRMRKLYFLYSEYVGFLENFVKEQTTALATLTNAHTYFKEKFGREMKEIDEIIKKG